VVSDSVINDHESTGGPSIGNLIIFHIIGEVCKDVIGQRRVVTENNSLFWIVALINPASVSSDYLVKEHFISIGADTNGRQNVTDDFDVTIFEPFKIRCLFSGLNLSLSSRSHSIHRLPAAAES
jgi:hypothetical protein